MELPFVCAECEGTGKTYGRPCRFLGQPGHCPSAAKLEHDAARARGNPALDKYFGGPPSMPRLYTEKAIRDAQDERLAPLFAAWDKLVEEVMAARAIMPSPPLFFMNETMVMRVDVDTHGVMEIKMKENK